MTGVVFMGTPEEAVPTLDALVADHNVELVVTRPDRPRGRSGTPQPPPVRQRADILGIEVAQPATRSELIEVVSRREFEVGVVVAYGSLIPPEVLVGPGMGFLNVHFSLLPRWRGAAPVARALMAGDTMTGVTIIRLDEGLDTGPVLTAQAVDIHPADNAGTLTHRLAVIGARLLARALPDYLSGELVSVDQSDEGLTYAAKISAEDRSLAGDADPEIFLGRVRGLSPTPGAILLIDDEPHKVLAARLTAGAPPPPGRWEAREGLPVVTVGDRAVALTLVQSPGRRPQPGEDWVRGRHRPGGTVG